MESYYAIMESYYVILDSAGPNDTGHVKYSMGKTAVFKEGFQTFKIVEYDTRRSTHISADGYCLHGICVKECTEEKYNKERGIQYLSDSMNTLLNPLIFN